jgi:ribonuclease HI
MTGEWRARGGLYLPYYRQARDLIKRNNLDLSFWWVPREQNEEADQLSKDALLKVGISERARY